MKQYAIAANSLSYAKYHYSVDWNAQLINAIGHMFSSWFYINTPPTASPKVLDTTVYGNDGFG